MSNKEAKDRMPYYLPNAKGYDVLNWAEHTDKFEKFLEKKMAKMKKVGVKIEDCPEYLESIVEEYVNKLKGRLYTIHTENIEQVERFFIRRTSDVYECKEMSELLGKQIAETEEDLKNVEKLYKDGNPLYKGKLKVEGEHLVSDEEGD